MNVEPVRIAIGLGSNLGDREANLAFGREQLALHGVYALQFSALYETDPVGPVADQDSFLNQIAIGETELPPQALLGICLAAERLRGRVRSAHWGPRVLDLDILIYGDCVVHEPHLMIPHVELTRRAFVLVPLAEVAGDWTVPGADKSVSELLAALPSREGVSEWRSSATKRQT